MRCPSCHHDNPGDASFCEGCGAKLELICPACKASVSPGARFCKKCGTAIGPTKSAVATTVSSPLAGAQIGTHPKPPNRASSREGGPSMFLSFLNSFHSHNPLKFVGLNGVLDVNDSRVRAAVRNVYKR